MPPPSDARHRATILMRPCAENELEFSYRGRFYSVCRSETHTLDGADLALIAMIVEFLNQEESD